MSVRSLHVELEDAASSSWWARVLYTLVSQNGLAQLRFVAKDEDGRRLYRGATFPAPPFGARQPREAWAPGMEESLPGLLAQIERDGWVEAGRGPRPWEYSYVRPGPPDSNGGREQR